MAINREIYRRRRKAIQHAAALDRMLQPGIRENARIWRRLRQQLKNAPVSQIDIAGVINRAMAQAAPVLADAMFVSWLMGLEYAIGLVGDRLPQRTQPQTQLAYKRQLAQLYGKLRLTPAEIKSLQEKFGERAIEQLTLTGDALNDRLRPVVRNLIKDGIPPRDAVKEMGAAVANAGLGPTKTYQLEAIYRTQSAISANASALAAMQSPLVAEQIWGYEYVTVGDDRVRPEHAEQDGTREPKDSDYWKRWWPPAGWNCVTYDTPITCIDGHKRADDVKVGDLLLTACGRYRPVIQVHRSEQPVELYAVAIDGLTLRATAEHKVATPHGWVQIAELQCGQKVHNLRVLSANDLSGGDIDNERYTTIAYAIKALSGLSATAAQLNIDVHGWQKEVDPVDTDMVVMNPLNPHVCQNAGQLRLVLRQLGGEVEVFGRIIAECLQAAGRCLSSHCMVEERAVVAKFLACLLDATGVQPIGVSECLRLAHELNIMGGENAPESSEAYAGFLRYVHQGNLPISVRTQAGVKSAIPDVINAFFRPESIGVAAIRLLSHVLPLVRFGDARNVDVKWAEVKRNPVLLETQELVITFSVGGDNSYVSNGITSSNCRCSAIPIYMDEVTDAEAAASPPVFTDAPDPGFASSPIDMLALGLDVGTIIGKIIMR